MPVEIREMLTSNTEKAVKAIIKFVDDEDPRVALKAAELLMDRAYGKTQPATEPVSFDLPDDTGMQTRWCFFTPHC